MSDDLEPLVTVCPKCSTQFRVNEAQLQLANGKVRCGACLNVFQGTDYLLWEEGAAFNSDALDDLDNVLGELGCSRR